VSTGERGERHEAVAVCRERTFARQSV